MAKVKFFETVHSPSPSPPHTYSEISDGYNCNKLKNVCSKENKEPDGDTETLPGALARNWSLMRFQTDNCNKLKNMCIKEIGRKKKNGHCVLCVPECIRPHAGRGQRDDVWAVGGMSYIIILTMTAQK
ncbi:uncharacterized protein LOC135345300 isoform X2 [Halichondria panicea]|uniref:uncharacterized protein LOC135345300 isoform X2 n=1 Tax=Halichondria panicea TaxID=6063 RepID=UPI00312B56E9